MALNIKDRIYQETATEGTGTLVLTNVKEGYQGFVALANGSQTYYCITNDESWEVGQGQYINDGTDTLSRTLLSSSTGALLDLKGNSSVFCTYPAEKGVLLNLDGNIQLPNVNTRFKNITSDQVTSPVVITEAVIVDGTAGTEGDLAKLLDVYTKDEIKDIEEAQNKEIAETYLSKVDGGTIKDSVIIDEPTQDVAYSSFSIMGRIDGTNGRTLLKDFHYSKTDTEKNDGVQYFGTQIGDSSIMNQGQIKSLIGSTSLPITGGEGFEMQGNLDMGDHRIISMSDPIKNSDAATKFYVDLQNKGQDKVSLYIKEATRRTDGGIDENQFVTNSDFQATTDEFYFLNAYNAQQVRKNVNDYETSRTAKITIYAAEDGQKVYTGFIKSIVAEGGNAKVTTNPLFVKVNYAWSFSLKAYAVVIENLVERDGTVRDTLKQTKEVK